MPFDYKKEYKEFYLPPEKPSLVTIPPMNYIAVEGRGDPNAENGEYKAALELLYGIAFTIKLCAKAGYTIEGYFPYVVPPLEGLWWQEGNAPIDLKDKKNFSWISMIRLPDFVQKKDFVWAVTQASQKKKKDFSKMHFFTLDEGECVQCMHSGSYDREPETIALMYSYAKEQNRIPDLTPNRRHHEIYLSDPRRCKPEKLKTVIRIPVKEG